MKQLSIFDPPDAPAIGTWHTSAGNPISFDEVCRDHIGAVLLVDRYNEYQAVRILECRFYDHQNPKNTDRAKGHWCRRIVYNGGGRDNSFCDEFDNDKDQRFYSWLTFGKERENG